MTAAAVAVAESGACAIAVVVCACVRGVLLAYEGGVSCATVCAAEAEAEAEADGAALSALKGTGAAFLPLGMKGPMRVRYIASPRTTMRGARYVLR